MPLRGLTKEQLAAVKYDGNLLLTACPGSGKTRTLVSKLAYTLSAKENTLRKRKIGAITYTNVAAETILDRLDQFGINRTKLWVGTIHGFCLEWIIKPYSNLNDRVSKGFRVADEYELREKINLIKKKFDISPFEDLPTFLKTDMSINAPPESKKYSAALEYHEYLISKKLIDFDLILTIANQLLLNNKFISKHLSNLFYSLLIDEYQDTNQVQYNIISSIILLKKTNIVLIGDIDQAIYTGLGAVVKNRHEVCREFGLDNIKQLSLSGCFRSTQKVSDFYSSFQDNRIKIESLILTDQEPSFIHYNKSIHKDELANYISTIIKQALHNGISPSEVIVLAPSSWDIIPLGNQLKKLSPEIPIDSPTISPMPRSIDNYWYELIRLYFTELNTSSFSFRKRLAEQILINLEEMGFSVDRGSITTKKVIKIINQTQIEDGMSIIGFIKVLVISFCNSIGISMQDSQSGMQAMNSLVDAVKKRIEDHNLDASATSLYSYFKGHGGIKVTTFHATKGEEYEVVIATGLLKGKLPHWDDIYSKERGRADYVARRLLYVISSRAKRYLYLTSETGHKTQRGAPYTPTEQLATLFHDYN